MKKRLVLFLLCLAFGLGGSIAAGVSVYGQRDHVEITETVLYGDKSFVDGLSFTEHSTYANQLYWDTTYVIGDNAQPETSFQFYGNGRSDDYPSDHLGISVSTFGSIGVGGIIDLDSDYLCGYAPVIQDMAARMQVGETLTETVDLSDYYDYYPFWFEADLSDAPVDSFETLQQQLQVFFQIPMPETYPVEITLYKNENGDIDSFDSDEAQAWDSSDLPSFINAVGDDACYFTFCTAYQGGSVDYSAIPGGLGIYRLPFSTSGSKTTTVHGEQLANIYPLEEGTGVASIALSSDELSPSRKSGQ